MRALRVLFALLLALTFFVARADDKVQAGPRITEVHYAGVSNLSQRDLENALPFALGDLWRAGTGTALHESIVGYYAKRGFYHASAKVQANPTSDGNVALLITVAEGKPCMIKSLWIDDPTGFKSKHVMLRFKARMADVIKLRAGDRYDEQALSDRVRELREWLVGEDYILANTDRVRLSYNDDRTEVAVVLAVDYGERVTLGFQGNTVFTNSELSEFIAQARATGLGKDYAGIIERKIADEYHNHAYDNVKIELRYADKPLSKHITFMITEGSRTELQEVRWEGLTDQNVKAAQDAFQNGVSRLVQRGYFVDKDVDKGVKVVLEDLKARGYLSSKLIAKSIQAAKAPAGQHRVIVVAQLAEGEQTLVGKIDTMGFSYLQDDKLRGILSVSEDKPFNPFAFEEGLQRLHARYVGDGYLDFKIITPDDQIVTFTENNRTANIRLRVEEGTRIKVGQVRVQGLQKTKEYVVTREVTAHTNDWWLGEKQQETELNLRKLGLFSEVKIKPVPSQMGADYRDMVIDIKEAEPGSIEVGPGFRSDLGLRAFSRVSYNNILGKNWIGSLGAEVNRRVDSDYQFLEYQFDASFVEPRLFGTNNLFSLGLSTKKQRFPPDFNAVSTEFIMGVERKLTKDLKVKLSYKLERIRQFDVIIDNQISAQDNQSMLIGSLVPSFTIDTRDNVFSATNGWLVNGSLEYAQPQFSDQSVDDQNAPAYQRWVGSVHRYTPITHDIVWSNVVAGGFERSDAAGRAIPLIKLFRLGGYSTIRGFQEDSINVDTYSIVGSLSYINLRSQIDFPLVGELKFAPFIDAGNLYIDRLQNSPFFRAGAGAGLHYMTPVGPVNLDWGFKLNPESGDTPSQIHFSVGLI